MKVVDFDFDPAWLARFLDFPQAHYAGDPAWLPDRSVPRQLARGPIDPGTSLWRNFLAVADDDHRILGRVTAILNPQLRDPNGQRLALFGFFECINHEQTAQRLIEAASAWLQARAPEVHTVLAPMNFDTWHTYRLRTSGFDQPPFALEPYNPPYYVGLLRHLSFEPVSRHVTKRVSQPAALLPAWEPYYRAALQRGYYFRSLNPAALDEELSLTYRLSLEIFHDTPLFLEIPESEFFALYAPLARALDPELLVFAVDPSGVPVGFFFAFPDRLQPATMNLKTYGVVPRARGIGLGAAFGYVVYRRFLDSGYVNVQHCLMSAGGRSSEFDRDLGTVTREYTLYSRSLR